MQHLFSTGLPRSGTSLISKMLYASNQASIAVGPNIEIYKFFRDKIVSKYGSISLKKKNKKNSPIPDYFACSEGEELLSLMLNSNLNEKFDKKNWKTFLKKSQSKRDHDSPDLIQNFNSLKGKTFKNIVLNLLNIIKKKRKLEKINNQKNIIYGFHETWNACSLKALAQSFPNAKFFIIIRDPRSIWASLCKNAEKRKELRVHLLSIVRHFRKYIMLADHYLNLSVFKNRLMIIKYENIVTNPEKYTKKICNFLNIKFNKDMLDPKKHYDFATNKTWVPYSAFSTKFPKLNSQPINKWKKYLSDIEVKSIEFLCRKEMKSMGYKLKFNVKKTKFNQVISFIKKDYNKKVSWRTDLRNFKKDKDIEISRNKILQRKIIANEPIIKKCFLFTNYSLSHLIKYYRKQK
jgi:hypothetical protein